MYIYLLASCKRKTTRDVSYVTLPQAGYMGDLWDDGGKNPVSQSATCGLSGHQKQKITFACFCLNLYPYSCDQRHSPKSRYSKRHQTWKNWGRVLGLAREQKAWSRNGKIRVLVRYEFHDRDRENDWKRKGRHRFENLSRRLQMIEK